MPRRLDSVNPGGFVEPIDVAEGEFEAVIALLGMGNDQNWEAARDRMRIALEDFHTARCRTAQAKTVREDLRDLEQLAEVADPERLTAPLRRAIDAAESIRSENPVLDTRLKWHFRGGQLREWRAALQEVEAAVYGIGRTFSVGLAELMDEIRSEDGRGRPRDVAAFKLASSLYDIWCAFTGKGTSRQNAPDRERDPFGDFVDAAGKLIDPDFEGHYVARQVHEARRQSRSGEN